MLGTFSRYCHGAVCPYSSSFFQEHLKEFFARYGHGLFLMSKLIKCVTENFSTEEELTEVGDVCS